MPRPWPATNNEQIGNNATAGQALTERGERSLQLGAAHEHWARIAHAAVKSWADR
jgi:hypothetical protein